MPISQHSPEYTDLMTRKHQDLQRCRSTASCQRESSMQLQGEELQACLIDMVNTDMVNQFKHFNLPGDFQKLMEAIPTDKRLEVVYARHPADRQIRGVKQTLPVKSKRLMTEDQFHEYYGHMGSGKNCILCALVRGSMRFIYKVVDKYAEARFGYFFDMDTLTVSHRASCGTQYYTGMRDR